MPPAASAAASSAAMSSPRPRSATSADPASTVAAAQHAQGWFVVAGTQFEGMGVMHL